MTVSASGLKAFTAGIVGICTLGFISLMAYELPPDQSAATVVAP